MGGTVLGGGAVGDATGAAAAVGSDALGGAAVGTAVVAVVVGCDAAVGGAVAGGGFAVPEVCDSPFTSVGSCGTAPGVVELGVAWCGRVVVASRPLWIEGCETGRGATTRMTADPTARNAKNARTTIRRSVTGSLPGEGWRLPRVPRSSALPVAPWGSAGDAG